MHDRRTRWSVFGGVLAIIALALTAGVVAAEPAAAKVADVEEITSTEFWDALVAVITDFRAVGVFAGFASLIGLLVMLSRIPRINQLLERHDLKWVKTLIAAVLGGLGAMFGVLAAGEPFWPDALAALLTGAIGGLTATGGHQVLKAKKDERVKKRLKRAAGEK